LLRFYGAHRALVRAKIACLQLADAKTVDAASRELEAIDYLDCASAAALTVPPVLMVMTGLSGTGKSTVARRLARALGARLFTSDVVRKELAGIEGAAPAAWEEGIYRREWTKATYDQLFALAEMSLSDGEPVVLDATFLDADQGARAADVARQARTRLVLVETICDQTTIAARLASRAARGNSPSDATMETYLRQLTATTATPLYVPQDAVAVRVNTATGLSGGLDPAFATLTTEGIISPTVAGSRTGNTSR